MTTTPDFDSMPDQEISNIVSEGTSVLEQRRTVAEAERRVDAMCLDYLRAAGRENGGAFEAPTGLIGAYPRGWRVTHEAAAYEATAPGVTTAPPGDGWIEVDPDSPVTPFWEPGIYDRGALVRDAGQVWTATSDVDGARPSEYPGGWSPAA